MSVDFLTELAHSWGKSPEQKKREKEYNAKYYQEHKEEILRNRPRQREKYVTDGGTGVHRREIPESQADNLYYQSLQNFTGASLDDAKKLLMGYKDEAQKYEDSAIAKDFHSSMVNRNPFLFVKYLMAPQKISPKNMLEDTKKFFAKEIEKKDAEKDRNKAAMYRRAAKRQMSKVRAYQHRDDEIARLTKSAKPSGKAYTKPRDVNNGNFIPLV